MPANPSLIFADPPYNIDWDYDKYQDKKSVSTYLAGAKAWISQIHAALTFHGSFWLAIGDELVSEMDVLCKSLGFFKRGHVLWYYTFGVNCVNNFTRSHTHLLYYTKHRTKFIFNADLKALRVPSARQLIYNDKRADPNGRLPDNTWILRPQNVPAIDGAESDTWHIPRVAGTFKERTFRKQGREHKGPPQLPVLLLERIITACSKPGDLVVDPFSGTGTTGVAALRLGRHYVGMDISKNYNKAATPRLVAASKQG